MIPMENNPAAAWICALAGIVLHGAALARSLGKRGRLSPKTAAVLLLPGLLGLLSARGGFELLGWDTEYASFRWCYTTGLLGLAAGTALAARAAGAKILPALDETAAAACLCMAAARLSQRWLGEVGAGPWLEENSIFRGSFLILRNQWDEMLAAIFIPEALAALAAAGIAGVLLKGRKNHSDETTAGYVSGVTVLLLTIPQILLEQFRTGHYMHWRMVRAEQVLCALAALSVILFFSIRRWKTCREYAGGTILPIIIYLLFCMAIILIQFVLDGKLLELPEMVCWGVYVLSIAGMLICGMASARHGSRIIR